MLNLISSTIEKEDTTVALKPENIFKNRDKNVIPGTQFLSNKSLVQSAKLRLFLSFWFIFWSQKRVIVCNAMIVWCFYCVAANRCRPYLVTPVEDYNNYINAVFLNVSGAARTC